KAVIVLETETRDFLNNLCLLVHLNREYPPILALVPEGVYRLPEALVELCNLAVTEVSSSKEDRHSHASLAYTRTNVHESHGDCLAASLALHYNLSLVVEVEVAGAPVLYPVKICRVVNRPPAQHVLFCQGLPPNAAPSIPQRPVPFNLEPFCAQ